MGSFAALLAMLAVIGFQVYISLPMLRSWLGMAGIKVPAQERVVSKYSFTPTPYIAGGGYVPGLVSPTQTVVILPTQTATPAVTQTPWVITATPVPVTSTPVVLATPIPDWWRDFVPPAPGRVPDPLGTWQFTKVRVSYYWPPYGYQDPKYEINCDKNPDGVLECEQMASGQLVKDWVGRGASCPSEFPYGTLIRAAGQIWRCEDRGGAIVRIDADTIWVDLLYPWMPIPGIAWGDVIDGEFSLP